MYEKFCALISAKDLVLRLMSEQGEKHMLDTDCSNGFAFDSNNYKVSPRDLLETFCKATYHNQTVVFLCGNDIDPLPGDDNCFQLRDAEIYEALRRLRHTGNVHYDHGSELVPVIVKDCSRELADRLRAVVYDRNIAALWYNNALDYFTD